MTPQRFSKAPTHLVEPVTLTISVSVWGRPRPTGPAIEEVIAAGGALLERGEHQPGSPYAYVTTLTGT